MAKTTKSKLSKAQKIFADEYLIDLNATRSYSVAFPAAKYTTCQVEGSKLLRNPMISAYIDERMQGKEDARIMKQDEVLRLLTEIARGDTTEQTLKGIGGGAQEIVENRVSEKERMKALELLGKRYGTFSENVNVNVSKSEKLADIMEQLKRE